MRQAMQQLVSELARPIVLSDRALRKLARIRAAQRELLQREGREPSPCDIAEVTGLPRDQVDRLIAAERIPCALEEPVGGDHGAGTTLGESLDDPRAIEAFERIPRRVDVQQLPRMLAVLNERERRIIAARFGLDGCERTLRELGEDLGVSTERVRQIEEASLGKLRSALRWRWRSAPASQQLGHARHPRPQQRGPRRGGVARHAVHRFARGTRRHCR